MKKFNDYLEALTAQPERKELWNIRYEVSHSDADEEFPLEIKNKLIDYLEENKFNPKWKFNSEYYEFEYIQFAAPNSKMKKVCFEIQKKIKLGFHRYLFVTNEFSDLKYVIFDTQIHMYKKSDVSPHWTTLEGGYD